MSDESDVYDTAGAADFLTISSSQVRKLASSGALKSHRLGPKLLRFRRRDLQAYLDQNLIEQAEVDA